MSSPATSQWSPPKLHRMFTGRAPRTLLIIVCAALLGVTMLYYVTVWGIGASPDSAAYIQGARHILTQPDALRGLLTFPSTHQPPFYSLFLALGGATGLDPLVSARWLHLALFAANIALFGIVLSLMVDSWWLVAGGLLLFATAAPTRLIHSFAWSEPLFMLLSFTGLTFCAIYLQKGKDRYWLAAALFTGLACLTRFAGVPFILAGAIAIALFSHASLHRRIVVAGLFTLLSSLPLMLWMVRNLIVAGATTSRQFAFHPVGGTQLRQFLLTVSGWLQIPDNWSNILRLAVWLGLLIFTAAVVIIRRNAQSPAPASRNDAAPLTKLLLLASLLYTSFLLFSISFFDANTPLDDRILSPLLFALIPLATLLIAEAWHLRKPRPRSQLLLLVLPTLLVILTTINGLHWLQSQRGTGLGYASPRWQQSPLLAEIRRLPQNAVIFSNAPEAIILLGNHTAQALPRKQDAMSQSSNDQYDRQLDDMLAQIERGDALVAYFQELAQRPVTTDAELRQDYGLQPTSQTADGVILSLSPGISP